mgnify:FL=1
MTQKYEIPIKILLCDKKNSSGRIKQNTIELRISKKLPKYLLKKHIESITHSLYLKIIKNPNLLSTTSTSNSCLDVVRRGFFYVGEFKILITLNSTKTRFKVERITDEEERKEIVISIPQIYSNKSTLDENTQIVERSIAKLLCNKLQYIIHGKVHKLNEQTLNSKLGDVTLNYVSSKWGHCTTRNNIMIHISLFNTPKEVFEYVIRHELAHTIHKNHSSSYWNLCNSLTPHTKYAKKYLKENPPTLFKENI